MSYQNDLNEANEVFNWFKKPLIWLVGLTMIIGGVVWFTNRSIQTVDTAFIRYEEFDEIVKSEVALKLICN